IVHDGGERLEVRVHTGEDRVVHASILASPADSGRATRRDGALLAREELVRALPVEVVGGVRRLGARLRGGVAGGLGAELVLREPAEDVVEEMRPVDFL